jgi:hypothetical protein
MNFEYALDLLKTRWGDQIKNDRYYSPNLSLNHNDFRISSLSRAPSS